MSLERHNDYVRLVRRELNRSDRIIKFLLYAPVGAVLDLGFGKLHKDFLLKDIGYERVSGGVLNLQTGRIIQTKRFKKLIRESVISVPEVWIDFE